MPAPARSSAGTSWGRTPFNSLTLPVALASSLAACAPSGDFGRPRPDLGPSLSQIAGDIVSQIRAPDGFNTDPALRTAVEREAQDRLAHFTRPIPSLPRQSATARFNALTDAIAADRALLPHLLALRPAIAAKDAIRAGAVAGLTQLPPEAAGHAAATAGDNRALFAQACRRVRERSLTYRRMLEHQVVQAPEVEAVATERSLLRLEGETRDICPAPGERAAAAPLRKP